MQYMHKHAHTHTHAYMHANTHMYTHTGRQFFKGPSILRGSELPAFNSPV